MGKIRGTHTSPGIYTQFTDVSYAAKTYGVTTLGLVGETLKGPAFEPVPITSWSEFKNMFGGTSAEKFSDSLYPKYELPYIAKSYLNASEQLYVCRVLGLSGYNAGPAFLLTAENDEGDKKVVAVLRSRGKYQKYANSGDACNPNPEYDKLIFDCDAIELAPFVNTRVSIDCTDTSITQDSTVSSITITSSNLGQFNIKASKTVKNSDGSTTTTIVGTYPVSLNAGTKEYIYNVLGSNPTNGTAAVFVEELYDVMLEDLVTKGYKKISVGKASSITEKSKNLIATVENIIGDGDGYLNVATVSNTTRTMVGKYYIFNGVQDKDKSFRYYTLNNNGQIESASGTTMDKGGVYYVVQINKNYYYAPMFDENGKKVKLEASTGDTIDYVKVNHFNNLFYINSNGDLSEIGTEIDMSDYHEDFRCASTPWIVSEVKSDGKNLDVKKLFRFHTISDGACANDMVKISIANICPDEGTFDVYIRDFNDTDAVPTILESYKGLNMVPGNSKYIGLKIGTLNGDYPSKSNYVMVEVIENDMTETCVPAGFLGYPIRNYGDNIEAPSFTYNTTYDENTRAKKQYFGLSDITGIDTDMLSYKGKNAYTENYAKGYTNGFHLDATLSYRNISGDSLSSAFTYTIDGETFETNNNDIQWDTVSITSGYSKQPIISSETDMEGTLYEDKKLRKFTVCLYGGFDGWDPYRNSRTNTDEYKANKYKGTVGVGKTFSTITNTDGLNLPANSIASDYYAYLAGAKQFENPEMYLINLFATPGIDYVNNQSLSEEILEMVEDDRGDCLYVMTTPDKPFGASDDVDEMYDSGDVADNLADTLIDSYYATTYYPWVKYYDSDNQIYINLPATKDALRNMADVDNKLYPWYAPAGTERGDVDCFSLHKFTKLEDEDNVYSGRINPLKLFSRDGIKLWGNKTMYTGDTPMNRINVVRLMLYMRKLINESCRHLIFMPNDTTLKSQFESELKPILTEIKKNRGITDYYLNVSQTTEQMDEHELSASLAVKPTPTLEYIEINFVVTPQGVDFEDL